MKANISLSGNLNPRELNIIVFIDIKMEINLYCQFYEPRNQGEDLQVDKFFTLSVFLVNISTAHRRLAFGLCLLWVDNEEFAN